MISNEELRLRILQRLSEEPVFIDYSVVKWNKSITKKDKLGSSILSINNSYSSVDLDRDNECSLMVTPWFARRFTILEKWFEDLFCWWDKKELKYRVSDHWHPDYYSKDYNPGWYSVDFLRTKDTFEDDYMRLREVILDVGIPYFKQVETLESFFQYRVLPVLNESCDPPINDFDWVPRYLVLTKITHPECYSALKEIINATIGYYSKISEPNYMMYKDKVPYIINYIDNHSFHDL